MVLERVFRGTFKIYWVLVSDGVFRYYFSRMVAYMGYCWFPKGLLELDIFT
jgi:hypothetical protein